MSVKGPNKIDVTKEELEAMYLGDQRATMKSIGEKFGVNSRTVERWLKHYGIPSKGRKGYHKSTNPELRDRDWLGAQLKIKTQVQISKELGVDHSMVSYWASKHGLADETKSKAIKRSLAIKYPDGQFGKNSFHWKGGRRKASAGYIYIYSPDHPYANKQGAVMEHRLSMEEKIGRYLEPGEVVHHINGIKDDNRPENLELKTNGTHISEHFKASHEVTKLRKENEELKAELARYKEKYGLLD